MDISVLVETIKCSVLFVTSCTFMYVTQSFYGDLMVILGSPGNHYYTGYTFDFNVK